MVLPLFCVWTSCMSISKVIQNWQCQFWKCHKCANGTVDINKAEVTAVTGMGARCTMHGDRQGTCIGKKSWDNVGTMLGQCWDSYSAVILLGKYIVVPDLKWQVIFERVFLLKKVWFCIKQTSYIRHYTWKKWNFTLFSCICQKKVVPLQRF